MNKIKYIHMFENINDSYGAADLRNFIRATWMERDNLAYLADRYRDAGEHPAYIRDTGIWYHGLVTRINRIDIVRKQAVAIERSKKHG